MSADTEVQENKISEAIFSWQFTDSAKYKKNIWWHAIALVVLAAVIWLCIKYSDPLFAVFLVLFYLVVLLHDARPAQKMNFVITPDGVKLGKNFYYYSNFDHFYVIYEDRGVKNLYLEFKNVLRGRLIVPLDGQDAVSIRAYLLNFLDEDLDREAEPLSERISRWLKF